MEHIAGVRCLDCPEILDIPVDIQTHNAGTDDVYDSVEVDMRPWHDHYAIHREAGYMSTAETIA